MGRKGCEYKVRQAACDTQAGRGERGEAASYLTEAAFINRMYRMRRMQEDRPILRLCVRRLLRARERPPAALKKGARPCISRRPAKQEAQTL